MALLYPGFWQSRFWPSGFWADNFWPEHTKVYDTVQRVVFRSPPVEVAAADLPAPGFFHSKAFPQYFFHDDFWGDYGAAGPDQTIIDTVQSIVVRSPASSVDTGYTGIHDGYWEDDYWAESYWDNDYWTAYGTQADVLFDDGESFVLYVSPAARIIADVSVTDAVQRILTISKAESLKTEVSVNDAESIIRYVSKAENVYFDTVPIDTLQRVLFRSPAATISITDNNVVIADAVQRLLLTSPGSRVIIGGGRRGRHRIYAALHAARRN